MLERLSGSLCDAVLDRTGSAAILHELDRADVFVVPLDNRHEWYRCHRLFRDALRLELDATEPGGVTQTLLRAADWFESHQRIGKAVRLHMAAGDNSGAIALLSEHGSWFFESGLSATYLQLGDQLHELGAVDQPHITQPCFRICVERPLRGRRALARGNRACHRREHASAAGLDVLPSGDPGHLGFVHPLRGLGQGAGSRREPTRGRNESDPTTQGFAVTRAALAGNLVWAERFDEAAYLLSQVRRTPSIQQLHTVVRLQTEGLFAQSLFYTDRIEEAARVLSEVSVQADAVEQVWGDAAAPAVSLIRILGARIAYQRGDMEALPLHERAVRLSSTWGTPTYVVMALVGLGEASLARGDRDGARSAAAQAREAADADRIAEYAVRELEAFETRLGRGAARTARRSGLLYEELTDRELSILRLLPGPATQREIGASLCLSINTVKGYTKSLYRKLGVVTRHGAVEQGRSLGLI